MGVSTYEFIINFNFEDEVGGVHVIEFILLHSKMYFRVKENGSCGMTAKRVKKNVIKKEINFLD